MDYTDYAEQLKKSLAAYGSAEAQIKNLYAQALSQNEKLYKAEMEQLDAKRAANRNQAVVDSQRSRRNTAHYLAGRGLTHSGESVQSELNENILLSNRLSALDSDYGKALKDALLKKGDRDLSAQKDYTVGSVDIANKKAEAEADIQKLLASAALNSGSASGSGSSSDSGSGSEGTDSDDGTYTPSSSVKDMAKNLLNSATEDGKVKTSLENAKLKVMLQEFAAENNLNPKYVKELELILKASGYYNMSNAYAEAYIAADYAKRKYQTWAYDIYSKLRKSDTVAEAAETAKEVAKDQQLAYIFTHCSTDTAFKKACRILGFDTDTINNYYRRAKKGGKYRLGMYAN